MNNRNIMGFALVGLAVVLAGLIASSAGDAVARLVGRAAWYMPYAALVGAVRYFRAA